MIIGQGNFLSRVQTACSAPGVDQVTHPHRAIRRLQSVWTQENLLRRRSMQQCPAGNEQRVPEARRSAWTWEAKLWQELAHRSDRVALWSLPCPRRYSLCALTAAKSAPVTTGCRSPLLRCGPPRYARACSAESGVSLCLSALGSTCPLAPPFGREWRRCRASGGMGTKIGKHPIPPSLSVRTLPLSSRERPTRTVVESWAHSVGRRALGHGREEGEWEVDGNGRCSPPQWPTPGADPSLAFEVVDAEQ
jgi:hypothetical protein